MNSLISINGISLRQTVTPEPLQSRVNTTVCMIAWGSAPFGAALGGLIAEATHVRTACMVMAGGVIVSAIIGWLSPLRTVGRPAPEPHPTEVPLGSRSKQCHLS